MNQNAYSAALDPGREIIIFFATGRGPIGSLQGMIYLYKDAVIVPIGSESSVPAKRAQIDIVSDA